MTEEFDKSVYTEVFWENIKVGEIYRLPMKFSTPHFLVLKKTISKKGVLVHYIIPGNSKILKSEHTILKDTIYLKLSKPE